MDPKAHKRFLDYRERHQYFGAKGEPLAAADFVAKEAEFLLLDAKAEETRDDEEATRHAELAKVLLRD